jgi:hypothetical protein
MWFLGILVCTAVAAAGWIFVRVTTRVLPPFAARLRGRLALLALGPLVVAFRWQSVPIAVGFTAATLVAVLGWTRFSPERLFPWRWFHTEPVSNWMPSWIWVAIILTGAAGGWLIASSLI